MNRPGLYVRARRYGSGVADRLVEAAIGEADALLWVLAANPRARAFYERIGFYSDGASKFDDEHGVFPRSACAVSN